MLDYNVYEDIAGRSGGDIYIGVVGPVRTGKSTLIKKFMTELVIPNTEDGNAKTVMVDELPQSASGKSIMTTEPKFVPAKAPPCKHTVERQAAALCGGGGAGHSKSNIRAFYDRRLRNHGRKYSGYSPRRVCGRGGAHRCAP